MAYNGRMLKKPVNEAMDFVQHYASRIMANDSLATNNNYKQLIRMGNNSIRKVQQQIATDAKNGIQRSAEEIADLYRDSLTKGLARKTKNAGFNIDKDDALSIAEQEFNIQSQKSLVNALPIGAATKRNIRRHGIIGGVSESWRNQDGTLRPFSIARDVAGIGIVGNAAYDAIGIASGTRSVTHDEAGNEDMPLVPFM